MSANESIGSTVGPHLDYYLSKPGAPPEERLFPVIDDLLDAWQAEYLPEMKGLRLVGHQWSPRSHAIKDFLASNLIPYHWLDVIRDPDARALLDAAAVETDAAAHPKALLVGAELQSRVEPSSNPERQPGQRCRAARV